MIYTAFILSYLIGSISFAILSSYIFSMNDPRSYGSKNAGATNVMRSGNKKAAIFTLVGDLVKGLIVVIIGRLIFKGTLNETIVAICGILVIIGHVYPIFFKFKGGKGVATALGVFLGFSPLLALLVVLSWIIVFKISKISSLSALIAAILAPVYAFYLMGNNAYFGGVLVIGCFILFTHKSNIVRLLTKGEHKFHKKDQ